MPAACAVLVRDVLHFAWLRMAWKRWQHSRTGLPHHPASLALLVCFPTQHPCPPACPPVAADAGGQPRPRSPPASGSAGRTIFSSTAGPEPRGPTDWPSEDCGGTRSAAGARQCRRQPTAAVALAAERQHRRRGSRLQQGQLPATQRLRSQRSGRSSWPAAPAARQPACGAAAAGGRLLGWRPGGGCG